MALINGLMGQGKLHAEWKQYQAWKSSGLSKVHEFGSSGRTQDSDLGCKVAHELMSVSHEIKSKFIEMNDI
jgi:hypothetical protein